MTPAQITIALFVIINILAFFMMGHDKRLSVRGKGTERTPEGLIFFWATLFGSIGVYAGMQIFRHKTRKWYFQIGIPLLILENLATIYLINQFISS